MEYKKTCLSVLLQIYVVLNIIFCVYGKGFYSYSAKDITGKDVKFSKYKGKVVLVVNVASECGFTDSHYKALVKAKKIYGADGHFEILAFPCNQFGGQEPKENSEIAAFVKEKYKVNFPMFSKINVKDDNVPDFWEFLNQNTEQVPTWNFWKYLIDDTGKVIKSWPHDTDVEEILSDVSAAVTKAKQMKGTLDKIQQALKDAQAKMGEKTGGLKFKIMDDL